MSDRAKSGQINGVYVMLAIENLECGRSRGCGCGGGRGGGRAAVAPQPRRGPPSSRPHPAISRLKNF